MNRLIQRKLTQVITGIRNVLGRDDFVGEVFTYLTEASIQHLEEGRLFVVPDSIDVMDALFHKEVSVGFRLKREMPVVKRSLQELQEHQSDPSESEYYLTPGTVINGEQVLYFTFTNSESFERNLLRFRRFINQSYISPEVILELNKESWKELALIEDRFQQTARTFS